VTLTSSPADADIGQSKWKEGVMADSKLPERASLEYLKKLAKERLRELRQTHPQTKLAAALLAVARDHGFSSWRALKEELEERQRKDLTVFFEACAEGRAEFVRDMVANEPGLARAENPSAQHLGWTGLHSAAQRGHVELVRLLLEAGANANAREAGDNTYALHWAAAQGHVECVRALLEAGGDVHGHGDAHELEVIGWATFYHEPPGGKMAVVPLLVEHGAQHHIFSAICMGDAGLVQRVAEENPQALDRRLSRFDGGLTALHFAIGRKRFDLVDLLIDLGADVEARNGDGHTAMESAMLTGDREAMSRLKAAGAEQPKPPERVRFQGGDGEDGGVGAAQRGHDAGAGHWSNPRVVQLDRVQGSCPQPG
jgi:ankyrin repeat protein